MARWLNGRAHVDLEAEEGPVRALRPASLALYRHDTFKAASALVLCGRLPIESITSLSCIVELDNFKALLKYLRERQGGQPSAGLRTLAGVLVAIAKHQGVDQAQIAKMSRISENYNVEDHVTRTHTRLQAFEDERLLGALLHLPDRLWEEAADPLLYLEKKVYLQAIREAISGVEAARVVLVKACRRIESEGRSHEDRQSA